MTRLILTLLSVVICTSVVQTQEICSVCGDGKEVNEPNAIFNFPAQPPTSCGDLESAGEQGQISSSECSVLPDLIENLCDCQPKQPSTSPSITPVLEFPSPAPTFLPCSICGDGKYVNDPDTIFSFPGQPPISCGDLEDNGEQGLLDPSQCTTLPILIGTLCDCQPIFSPSTLPSAVPITVPSEFPSTILPSESSSTVPSFKGCSVCGEGKYVNDPNATFAFPGQPTILCDELEANGEQGLIIPSQCALLPQLIETLCDCQPIASPSAMPSILPSALPSESPSRSFRPSPFPPAPPSESPSSSVTRCSICGEGKSVNDPDAIFSFPGQPPISCGELEDNGEQGLVNPSECDFLPELIEGLCDCQFLATPSSIPSSNPTTLLPPTFEPCSVCGEGEQVNKPDAIFSFPSQAPISCGDLEDAGEQGLLEPGQCESLPFFISSLCDCQSIAASPTSAPTFEPCSVCGEGEQVNKPDAIFSFPSQAPISCGDLEDAGEQGLLEPGQCESLPFFISSLCDCQSIAASPTSAPTFEPCSVCGNGKHVNNPEAIFNFPSQPPISCGDLEDAGEQGLLEPSQCEVLPSFINNLCDCQVISGSPFPTTTPITKPPSKPPSTPPSESPSKYPSQRPTTDSPTKPAIPGVTPKPTATPAPVNTLAPIILPTPTAPPQAPASTPFPTTARPSLTVGCSICGEGKEVTKPDDMFNFLGHIEISCGELEIAGKQGHIPIEQCILLPDLVVDTCGCQPIPGVPTIAPVIQPTPFPIIDGDDDDDDNSPTTFDPTKAPSVTTPRPTSSTGCSVCGEGKQVEIPDAPFFFPGQPLITCGVLELEGEQGYIPPEQCNFLSDLVVDTCGCQPIPGMPTIAPVIKPTPFPVIDGDDDDDDNSPTTLDPTKAPSVTTPRPTSSTGCSVCGEGKHVGIPDAPFFFPGQPLITCGVLELEGEEGFIAPEQCAFLPPLIGNLCGCQLFPSSAPSATPTALPSVPPTPVPSKTPSVAPSFLPSASPSAKPSALPSSSPTRTPSRTPSVEPTLSPSTNPSAALPSVDPTLTPTFYPSIAPSISDAPSISEAPSGICDEEEDDEDGKKSKSKKDKEKVSKKAKDKPKCKKDGKKKSKAKKSLTHKDLDKLKKKKDGKKEKEKKGANATHNGFRI